MIKYLFTRNNLIGSRVISSATKCDFQKAKETPSHFSILFQDRWVFHSNFANGVHIEPYYSFKNKHKIIASLRDEKSCLSEIECNLFQDQLIRETYGRKYDWPAIAYFSWRIILNYIFKLPFPNKNKWESENKWFCNELFEVKFREDLSMTTPNDLMWLLLKHPDFTTCEVFP